MSLMYFCGLTAGKGACKMDMYKLTEDQLRSVPPAYVLAAWMQIPEVVQCREWHGAGWDCSSCCVLFRQCVWMRVLNDPHAMAVVEDLEVLNRE